MNRYWFLVLLTVIVTGCSGGKSDGGTGGNPVQKPVHSIEITPAELSIHVGENKQFFTQLKDSSGKLLSGRNIAWHSSSPNNGSINSAGMLTALAEGSTTVTASVEGKYESVEVEILLPIPPVRTVTQVELNTTFELLEEGQQLQLLATPRDENGEVVEDRVIGWTSNNTNVLLVEPDGVVTAVGAGTTTIKAKVEGVESFCTVQVFGDYAYELMFSKARVGEFDVLHTLDIGDPLAEPYRIFGEGKRASHVTPSPDGKQFAFVVYGTWETSWQSMIYVVNRNQTGVRRLTFNNARNEEPAWSPDGTSIAFSSWVFGEGADIWTINVDGSDALNLTEDQGEGSFRSPSWSPVPHDDSYRIAYSSSVDGHGYIWSMRDDGSDKQQLTFDTEAFDTEPDWSPDGNNIVFIRSTAAIFSDLYLVSSTGGMGRALMSANPLAFGQFSPKWSPDGRLIAFTSDHDGADYLQVWTVWADGTRVVKRTFENEEHTDPNWLPFDVIETE